MPPSQSSNLPGFWLVAPVKAPFLVAEEFGLDEVLRDRGAVDGEERPFGAQGVLVDAAGDEFLARAAFAGDEHGRVARGDLADGLQDFLHRFGTADDAFLVVGRVHEHARRSRRRREVATGGEGLVDERDQLGLIERLHHVVVGAELHRLDRGLRRAERGHQDHHRLRLRAAEHLQGLDAGHATHAIIEEDHVRLVALGGDDAGLAAVRFDHRVAEPRERTTQRVAEVLVVIDDQDFGVRGGGVGTHHE